MVVDAAEQDGLIEHGESTGDKAADGLGGVAGQLAGMIRVDDDEDGEPETTQECEQFGRDPVGQDNRQAGVDAQPGEVGDRVQLLCQLA